MKDTRDPTEIYKQLLMQKTTWNCSIVEAADRVEAERGNAQNGWSTVFSAPPRDFADYGPSREAAPQNGAQGAGEAPEADAT